MNRLEAASFTRATAVGKFQSCTANYHVCNLWDCSVGRRVIVWVVIVTMRALLGAKLGFGVDTLIS